MNNVTKEIYVAEGKRGERREKGERKRESEEEGREEDRKAADGKEQIIGQSSISSTQELLDLLATHLITVLAIVTHYWLRRGRREDRENRFLYSKFQIPLSLIQLRNNQEGQIHSVSLW